MTSSPSSINGAAKAAAGVRELPATVIVNGTGKVVWVAPEGATPDDMVD